MWQMLGFGVRGDADGGDAAVLEGMDRGGGIVKGREESSEPANTRESYFDRR